MYISAITTRYIIKHEVLYPSKLTDYDYDNNGGRYLTTLFHKLSFLDNITESNIIQLDFTSEVCAKILLGLYEIAFGDEYKDKEEVSIVLDDAYIDGSPALLALSKINNNMKLNILIEADIISLIFDINEISNLISLLEIDDEMDMYVIYSSDR